MAKTNMPLGSSLKIVSINLLVFSSLWLTCELAAISFERFSGQSWILWVARSTTERSLVRPDAELGFALVNGYVGENGRLRINYAGFRRNDEASTLENSILVIGDSVAFGWNSSNGQDFPAQLETMFRDQGSSVRVMNQGVPSFTSTQTFLQLRRSLKQGRPLAIIVSVSWNDIWHSTWDNWNPKMHIPPFPGRFQRFLLKYSALSRLIFEHRLIANHNKVHPGAEVLFKQNITRMIDEAAALQIPIYFLEPTLSPSLIDASGLDVTGNSLSREFVVAIGESYSGEMRSLADSKKVFFVEHPLGVSKDSDKLYFSDPIHPNALGHQLIAQKLFQVMQVHWGRAVGEKPSR